MRTLLFSLAALVTFVQGTLKAVEPGKISDLVRGFEINQRPSIPRSTNSSRKMSKIIIRRISPAVSANSFAAKPKTIYRVTNKYCRIEEPPDPERRVHNLYITKEPDSWTINLLDKTARHILDPGPTFIAHIPIIWAPKPKRQPNPDKEFKDLEFGNEAQFFREHSAREIGMRSVGGRNCNAVFLKIGSREVALLLESKTGKPYQIDVVKDGKLDFSVRYLFYETNLPFQKSLFELPKGVKIIEAKAKVYYN